MIWHSRKQIFLNIKNECKSRKRMIDIYIYTHYWNNRISINMENNELNDKVKMPVSEIISKCRRKEDWINFVREIGKSISIYFRPILSKPTWFWWQVLYTIFERHKISKIKIFILLVTTIRARHWIFF